MFPHHALVGGADGGEQRHLARPICRLEFELGAWFEGACGFALVLALSQMREHGLGPFGRADLHPRCNPLDRQGRFAPQPGSDVHPDQSTVTPFSFPARPKIALFLVSVRANKEERYFRLLPIVKIIGHTIFTVANSRCTRQRTCRAGEYRKVITRLSCLRPCRRSSNGHPGSSACF